MKQIAAIIGKVFLLLALGGSVALAVLSPAASAGTSKKTNGCYSTWGDTGTDAHCLPATATGQYRNHANCDYESDLDSSWLTIGRNSYVDHWGQLNCTFSVSSSYVVFRG